MSLILTYMYRLILMFTHICYGQIYEQILNFKNDNSKIQLSYCIIVLKGTIYIMTFCLFVTFLPYFFVLMHRLEFCGQC